MEIGGAFGDADSAARIQHVEQVTALQHVVIGRDDGSCCQGALALIFVDIINFAEAVDVGNIEVVHAMFDFAAVEDIAVLQIAQPVDLPGGVFALQRQGDTLQTIGDFDRNGIEFEAACLLEIGELGDLLPIHPHFPTEAPGTQRRAFPVVFDEADVMLTRADAEGLQRLQVEFLRVAGVWLEDDLILEVVLHPVGVFAKAPIIRADARLDVGHAPGFWPEDTEQGGRVIGPRADLHVIWIPDQAALRRPEFMQLEDHLLKVERLSHVRFR